VNKDVYSLSGRVKTCLGKCVKYVCMYVDFVTL
jgi:hypothetical protein